MKRTAAPQRLQGAALDRLPTYPLLDPAPLPLPDRCRLHHLELVGLGTPETESLTSLLGRLADEHGLTTRTLMREEIFPAAGRSGLAEDALGDALLADAVSINGLDGQAQKIADATAKLAGYSAGEHGPLTFSTMLTWRNVVASHGLLRWVRAYCPWCYREMAQSAGPVYDRLVWALAVVRVCARHHVPLFERCLNPACGREMPVLGPIRFR